MKIQADIYSIQRHKIMHVYMTDVYIILLYMYNVKAKLSGEQRGLWDKKGKMGE